MARNRPQDAPEGETDEEMLALLERFLEAKRPARRDTETGLPPPAKTPTEADLSYALLSLRVENERLKRTGRTVPPTPGNFRWWAKQAGKVVAFVAIAGGSALGYLERVAPGDASDPTARARVSETKSVCEARLSELERSFAIARELEREKEDWLAAVLQEEDFKICREPGERPFAEIGMTRPINRAIRPAIEVRECQPITPGRRAR